MPARGGGGRGELGYKKYRNIKQISLTTESLREMVVCWEDCGSDQHCTESWGQCGLPATVVYRPSLDVGTMGRGGGALLASDPGLLGLHV